ncbi:RNA polymerase factor sigma-54 [Thermanaerothrix sp.]|uniref:RNA polymerase factor sigma-54 n=1 Tax=Thermanaerothrix sp. TaxID=2972675 RepID=UPI003C7D3646
MYQIQQTSTRTIITAHLTQTMSLLHQSVEELWQKIQAELANPALELTEERRCPMCQRLLRPNESACPICSKPRENHPDEIVVFISSRDDFLPSFSGERTDEENNDLPEERFFSEPLSLPNYVLRQVIFDLSHEDQLIAAHLVMHLDEDGLLSVDLEEVANYFHVPISRVERVRRAIQRVDPIGVGSFTPQEAMLVQLEVLGENQAVPEAVAQLIQDGLDELGKRHYAELARKLHLPLSVVKEAARFISENLNPYPARGHWGDIRTPSEVSQRTLTPDVIISHLNDDPQGPLVVEIILPLRGTLRINPIYRQALFQAEGETREELRNDLERASLFIKCLQQRNHTLLRLMRRVVELQRDYILRGERYLRPITRNQIARELGLHESTISRAVAQKNVQLPNKRIVPLASFFDRNSNVRSALREIIASESSPLSDAELAERLRQQGFKVARRTVAKYRMMEGILPAHLRRSSLRSSTP